MCHQGYKTTDPFQYSDQVEGPVTSNLTYNVDPTAANVGATIATKIPALPISDTAENSSYSCTFGLRQVINAPSAIDEADLYNWKYSGGLNYGNWNNSKHNLTNANELTIYEGTNDAGGIQVSPEEIPTPVENLQPSARQENVNGPIFQDYPNGTSGGQESIGEGSVVPSRNPLSE